MCCLLITGFSIFEQDSVKTNYDNYPVFTGMFFRLLGFKPPKFN